MQTATAESSTPWFAHLDEEIAYDKQTGEASNVASILRDLVLAYPQDGHRASAEAALRVDADYHQVYLPSDPLLKGQDDQGMEEYLDKLCRLVLATAQRIPYDDDRQDAVVQLFVELAKLPPKAVKIWGEDCMLYRKNPVFGLVGEEQWNASFPNDETSPSNESEKEAFTQRCDEWVNLSTFFARCDAAGLYDGYEDRLKYPSIDIPLGLEKGIPSSPLGYCRLMVALQWLIHASGPLYDDMARLNKEGWNLARWKLWKEKLEAVVGADIKDARLAAAVPKAVMAMQSAETPDDGGVDST